MSSYNNQIKRLREIQSAEETNRGLVKVVLINTPLDYYESNSDPKYDTIYPFGLLILSEISKSIDISTIVVDGESGRLSTGEICEFVNSINPVVVGINLLSPTIKIAQEIVSRIAKKGRVVVAGGPHATFEPDDCFLKIPEINYLFLGDATKSWMEFLLSLDLNSNKRLQQKIEKGICIKGLRETQLDKLPVINRAATLYPFYSIRERRETSIFASIGCQEKCKYCAGRAFSKGIVSYRGIKSLIDEIEYCVKVLNIEAFHFADDNFIQRIDYLEKFNKELKKRRISIKWRSFARVDNITKEIIPLLIDSGCCRLTFGVESGCNRTLRNMGKGHTVEDAFRAISFCKSANIETKSFFMLGYPGETRDEIEETVGFSLLSGLDWAYYYLVRAFPGTVLFKELMNNGYKKGELLTYVHWIPELEKSLSNHENNYKKYLEENGFFNVDSILKYNVAHKRSINKNLRNEQLAEIMADAYRRFYFREEFVERFTSNNYCEVG